MLSAAPGSTYTYGNASWKDLLTAFNGEKIVYEGQTMDEDGNVTGTPVSGNPIRYYNGTPWNFSWAEGRSLKTAESSTPEQDISLEFSYDADGLRIEKHVTKTVYEMTADHTYTDTVVAPTCTEAGYTLHECECGYSYTDTEVPALGHDYAEETETYSPTCTRQGYTLHTCTRCGGTEKTDLVPALGHRYSAQGVQVVAPTCTEMGYTRCLCTVCAAAVKVNYVAPLGHDFQRVGASIAKKCSRCGLIEGSTPGITTPTQPSGGNYSLDEPIEPEVLPEEPSSVSEEESEPEATTPLRHRGAALATTTEEHSYIYAGGKLLRETITEGEATRTLDFSYDNVGMPYSLIYNDGTITTTYYYITNLQGDVMYLVDANGVQVAAYDYDPYGKIISATGDLAEINPLRYRGYYYDSETGFYYLQSRYYDPEICRFINADSYASTGQGYMGYNMFAYCNNSPVLHSDPSGEILVTTVILIVSIAVGVTVAAVTAYESRKAGCDWADTAFYSLGNGLCAFAAVYTFGMTAYNVYINICTLAGRTPVTEINLGGSNSSDIDISSQLQACADKANASVPGRGPQVGTQKHTIFAEEVNALGNDSLRTEVSYKNGVEVPYGTAGSTRFDVMQFDKFGNPFRAWDFKTGAALLTQQRITTMRSLSGLYFLNIDMIK